jgi:HPt (histidine-containing phosphotransfer) domain-containing protein
MSFHCGGDLIARTGRPEAHRLPPAYRSRCPSDGPAPNLGRVRVGAIARSDLMYSSAEDQAGMPALIARYIEHARQVAEQLQRADEAEELPRVRTLCLDLKGSAPGVGFARLGDLANDALHLLDTTGSLDAAAAQIKQLRVMCERLGLRGEERGEDEGQAGRPSG